MKGLHSLKRYTQRKMRAVGRGGKRGKTSGRGTKGQNARAGRKKRPEIRDVIKRIPKRRGFGKNRSRTVWDGRVRLGEITLAHLDKAYASGETVTLRSLSEKFPSRVSMTSGAKILATGELNKKLTISGVRVSSGAKSAIEKAGGTVS